MTYVCAYGWNHGIGYRQSAQHKLATWIRRGVTSAKTKEGHEYAKEHRKYEPAFRVRFRKHLAHDSAEHQGNANDQKQSPYRAVPGGAEDKRYRNKPYQGT